MNTEIEPKISSWNRQTVGFAIRELGEAISTSDDHGFLYKAKAARRYIDEMLGEVFPLPKLTEDEANLSQSLHTYMRKCMDTSLSVILYRLISESRGMNTWHCFIKGICSKKEPLFENGLRKAKEVSREIGTTDELFMESALHIWFEHESGQDDLNTVVNEWIEK